MKTVACICRCGMPAHQILLQYDGIEDELPMFIVTVHLNKEMSFFKRVLNAVRYVFGIEEEYGHFDEVLMKPEDVFILRDSLNEFLDSNNKTIRHGPD